MGLKIVLKMLKAKCIKFVEGKFRKRWYKEHIIV